MTIRVPTRETLRMMMILQMITPFRDYDYTILVFYVFTGTTGSSVLQFMHMRNWLSNISKITSVRHHVRCDFE